MAMIITVEQIENAFKDSILEVTIISDKAFLEMPFSNKYDELMIVSIIITEYGLVLQSSVDNIRDTPTDYNALIRFDCSRLHDLVTGQKLLQKRTDLETILEDTILFMQCLIILDGLR
jgi:hypothetical protein